MECLFCKIAAGTVKSQIVYRDDALFVLRDVNPQAPVHLLVIPTKHYATLAEAAAEPGLLATLLAKCAALGSELGGEQGYRLVVNTGSDGGQTVDHLHFHILAGRKLLWPPG